MSDTGKTMVDGDVLERYCTSLPECRRFLQNFFQTCGPFEYEDNLANYRHDLDLYSVDRSHIRANREALALLRRA